jgi:hypothetical protein
MKLLSFLITILFLNIGYAQKENNEILRQLFHQENNEENLDKIIEYKTNMKGFIPEAYFGSAIAMKAQYPFSPIKKYKYFSDGTELIENSIGTNQVVENTYLRLLIQLNTPQFLGYHKNIQEDILFVEKHIDHCSLSDKWKLIFIEQILLFEHKDYDFKGIKKKLTKYKTQ